MKEISIDQANEGDVLALDLTAGSGAVILARGNVLSASVIARLKKMGMRQIFVKEQAPQGNSEATAMLFQLLEDRFTDTENNPFLQEMKSIVADHITNPA
ncbi:MAG: hypothetical protein A2283_10960 [Lentisphaerae bacterium RIFOXYA12_FULL_48_11]|nr:MAG: hypothetical protein A2283_10960 [Lentisphaerae bacterium RIFOXYA12_FULL_48_11]